MYSTYRLKADELSNDFLNAIKNTYQHKEIEIIIQDVSDETDYLLSSSANREHLLKSVSEINNHNNLIQIDTDTL